MTKTAFALLLGGVAMCGLAAPAQAGCLSGAAVGGVVGHVAGHHGVLGAAAGCAIGHSRTESRREERDQRADAYRRGPDRDMYGRDAYRDDERR